MGDVAKTLEVTPPKNGDALPEDYWLARELAWAGSNDQAKRIYCRLLAETASPNLRATVYNDLAALAAMSGDIQTGRQLLEQALESDAQCEGALENWNALACDLPSNGRRGQAYVEEGVGCQVFAASNLRSGVGLRADKSALVARRPRIEPVPEAYGETGTGTSAAAGEPVPCLPIYGFMHVGTLNHWHGVVAEQLLKLRASGLWDRTERIFVGLVGPEQQEFDFEDPKLAVVYRSVDVSEAEYPTLKALEQFCTSHDCLVYYMHTKGTFHVSENTRDWRHLMEYFVIQRHEDCIRALVDHDACGVNLLSDGPFQAFFAGNFWWARSAYIRRLPPLRSLAPDGSRPDRHTCERWIGMNRQARLATLHQCPVDQYHNRYPRSNYVERGKL
jgi:hypothetical protein